MKLKRRSNFSRGSKLAPIRDRVGKALLRSGRGINKYRSGITAAGVGAAGGTAVGLPLRNLRKKYGE